jgi:hypothetical protein
VIADLASRLGLPNWWAIRCPRCANQLAHLVEGSFGAPELQCPVCKTPSEQLADLLWEDGAARLTALKANLAEADKMLRDFVRAERVLP